MTERGEDGPLLTGLDLQPLIALSSPPSLSALYSPRYVSYFIAVSKTHLLKQGNRPARLTPAFSFYHPVHFNS